jgi:hypothetical protein
MSVKYPHIKVRLTGKDGNAFSIMGFVQAALKRGKVPQNEISEFIAECMSGDYDNLLQVCCKTVHVT